jgi:oligopeptide transport system substrate-binding protein
MFSKKIPMLVLASILSGCMLVGCTQTTANNQNASNLTGRQIIQNQDARLAIAMAIDKAQITDVILNNGSLVANAYMPEGLALDENGKDYREIVGEMGFEFDKDKAAEHWKKAKEELGFENATLEFLTTDSDTSKKIGEYIQNQLEVNLEGLSIEIKQVPFKQKQQLESQGDFELLYSSWIADYPDPLTFLETFTTTGKFGSNSGYANTEYNKLVNEAKNSLTLEESWNKYGEAEKILLNDAYISPVYQSSSAYLEKTNVKDIVKSAYGARNTYKWAYVEGKDSFNITSSADLPSLDASKTTDFYSFDVLNNIMEGLTRVDKDGKIVEAMATSWETSEDKKTWTFTINDKAYWANGDKVTAHDFEYAWKRTLNPDTASQYGFIFYDIVGAEDYSLGKASSDDVGVKALDDNTLQVTLVRPVNYFDRLVGFPVFFPQNQKFVESKGDKYGTTKDDILANGPFELTRWKLEDQYTLTKNEKYWDKDVVKLQTVNTKIVKDSSTGINLYEAGEVDSIDLAAEQIDKFKDSPEFKSSKNATTFFIMMNATE